MKSDLKYLEKEKLDSIKEIASKIKRPNIIELGVHHGHSTSMFLDVCEKNDGYLTSIDIKDDSSVSNSKKWKFILSSDDNFEYIGKLLQNKFDILYIDSLHEAKHIEKVFYFYFNFVKVGGLIIVDDLVWLPYTKNSVKDNSFVENTNRQIFYKILEIYNSNIENLTLNIDFQGSGLGFLKKKKEKLYKCKRIISREYSIKNILKKLIYSPHPRI